MQLVRELIEFPPACARVAKICPVHGAPRRLAPGFARYPQQFEGPTERQRAHELFDEETNEELGFPPDLRDYRRAAEILDDLGVQSVHLLTNNPSKVAALLDYGIQVTRRVPHSAGRHFENDRYLRTKSTKMGHILEFESES